MNYERIYKEFISDRRQKENTFSKTKYTEPHNIKPKCMGGGDEKENIIHLVPEDRFFANLLLAKSYGKENWISLNAMLSRGNKTEPASYKDFANKRKQFGFIRRLLSKQFAGRNNNTNDKNSYKLKSLDGTEVSGDRLQLSKQTGLSHKAIDRLIKGNTKVSGVWYYPTLNPTGMTANEFKSLEKSQHGPTLNLYHMDGREWTGTSYDFYKEFGNQLIFYSEIGNCRGWFKTKELASSYLEKRKNGKNISNKIFAFEDIRTKEVSYHSKSSFSRSLEVSKEKVDDLILGKIKQLKGKRLVADFVREEKKPYKSYYKFKFLETGEICKLSIPKFSKEYGIPKHILYQLVKGRVKVAKKFGITLA